MIKKLNDKENIFGQKIRDEEHSASETMTVHGASLIALESYENSGIVISGERFDVNNDGRLDAQEYANFKSAVAALEMSEMIDATICLLSPISPPALDISKNVSHNLILL